MNGKRNDSSRKVKTEILPSIGLAETSTSDESSSSSKENNRIWWTIIVIVWFEKYLSKSKTLWQTAQQKAVNWLKGKKIDYREYSKSALYCFDG